MSILRTEQIRHNSTGRMTTNLMDLKLIEMEREREREKEKERLHGSVLANLNCDFTSTARELDVKGRRSPDPIGSPSWGCFGTGWHCPATRLSSLHPNDSSICLSAKRILVFVQYGS
jgi:hypothetical protein